MHRKMEIEWGIKMETHREMEKEKEIEIDIEIDIERLKKYKSI